MIDTNVWISAALSSTGAPAQVVKRVLNSGMPVFSDSTFAEIESRLWKPKFDRYLSMESRRAILHDAKTVAHWVAVPQNIVAQKFSRDTDDDKFVHAALASTATWLVTGDQDFLVLDTVLGVQILTPAEALRLQDFCPSNA